MVVTWFTGLIMVELSTPRGQAGGQTAGGSYSQCGGTAIPPVQTGMSIRVVALL